MSWSFCNNKYIFKRWSLSSTNDGLVSLGLWVKTTASNTRFAGVRHQDGPHGPASALPGLFWEPCAQLRWHNDRHFSCDAQQRAAQLPVLPAHRRLVQRLLPLRQHQLQPPNLARLFRPVGGGVPAGHLPRCLPVLWTASVPCPRVPRGEPRGQSQRGLLHPSRAGRAGLREGQDAGGKAEGDQRAHLETPARAEARGGAEAAAAEAEEGQLSREEAAAPPGRPRQAGRRRPQLSFRIPAGSREKTERLLGGPAAGSWRCSAPAPRGHCLCGALRSDQRTSFHIPQPAELPAAFAPRGREKPSAHQFAPLAKQPLLPTRIFGHPRRRAQGLLTCRQPGAYCTGKDSWPHAWWTRLPGSGLWTCSC